MPIDPKRVDTLEEIQEIVDTHLSALKFFPTGSVAVARLVAELVASTDQARQLCRAVVEDWDEWPGPASLRRKYLEMFRRDALYGNPPRLIPVALKCQVCQDWGRVRDSRGVWVPCTCTPDFPLDVLEALNRASARQRPAPSAAELDSDKRTRLITQEDIDRLLAAKRQLAQHGNGRT